MGNQTVGKLFILLGIVLLLAGVLFYIGKFPSFLGKLPGDIRIERPNFSFYFPITTGILLSILLSFIFYLISRFRG
ncbi:MAG: DUF2905 domain-containing protein [bacterium]